jgi:hypothetical protein
MDDRSRVLTAAGVGAVLGGLWGWLYLTSGGGAVRGRVGPGLDRFVTDVAAARAEAEKAHAALTDARAAIKEVVGAREPA